MKAQKSHLLIMFSIALIGLLIVNIYIYTVNNNTANDSHFRIILNVYIDGLLVHSQYANSPVENWGRLFSSLLFGGNNYGGYVITTLTDLLGNNDEIYIINIYESYGEFYIVAIDDDTPVPFSRGMYNPFDASSNPYYLSVVSKGYYVDSNQNLVIYIQSAVLSPTSNITIEAVSLILEMPVSQLDESNLYLLFYDILSTPITASQDQAIQFEYQLVFP